MGSGEVKPSAMSTFSGPGGSSVGYANAGFDVKVAVDCAPEGFTKTLLEVYKLNHPDTVLLERDMRELDPEWVMEEYGLQDLDLLDGSPPCSPFSNANNKVAWGDHKSGTLFDTYVYFIEKMQPKLFTAENVPGLSQGKTKGYFNVLTENMRKAGYNLRVQLIDATYLGSPHHRRRLIFMGVRKDIGHPPVIQPSTNGVSVREALEGVPNTPEDIKQAEEQLFTTDNAFMLMKLKQGQKLKELRDNYGYSWGRLSWNYPAPTFTSSSYVLHPSEDRVITIPELKRIIGMPDDYKLVGSYPQKWECLIRCLPPILMETVSKKMREATGI